MELLFHVDSPLSSSQMASILEAGVTYILYQRGQIPMPYQQLQVSALQQKKLEDAAATLVNNANFRGQIPVQSMDSSEQGSKNPEVVNPRDRISAMISERKKRLLLGKLERQRSRAVALESKAYNSIQSAFEVLKGLLVDVSRKNIGMTSCGHPKKIVSTTLVLGPSLYCPKEVYCFDVPFPYVPDESNFISKAAAEQFESRVLRQFYKKIITDSDLMDFTSKPLAKTYAHICLVTFGDLNSVIHGNSYYQDVIRLPSIPPVLLQMISNFGHSETESPESTFSSRHAFTASRKKTNKYFKFKIQYNGPFITEHESIDVTHSSSSIENSKNVSFSGDILFDNNSFSCYQIPLRFKGVQCKNKRL